MKWENARLVFGFVLLLCSVGCPNEGPHDTPENAVEEMMVGGASGVGGGTGMPDAAAVGGALDLGLQMMTGGTLTVGGMMATGGMNAPGGMPGVGGMSGAGGMDNQGAVEACAPVTVLETRPEVAGESHWVYRGLIGGESRAEGSCAGAGAETVVVFEVPTNGVYTLAANGPPVEEPLLYDSAIHVRSTCDDPLTELGCNADLSTDDFVFGSGLQLRGLAGERWYVFVEISPDFVADILHLDVLGAAEHGAPEVINAVALYGDEDAEVRFEFHDVNADAVHTRVQFSRDGTDLGRARTVRDWSRYGRRVNEAVARFPMGEDRPTHATITVLDSFGLESEPMRIPVMERPRVPFGDPCDPDRRANVCPPDARCADDGDGWVCVRPTPPRIDQAQVFFNPYTGAIGMVLSGADEENDLAGFRLRLLDADGNGLDSVGEYAEFSRLSQMNGTFEVSVSRPFDALFEADALPAEVTEAILVVIDETALESEPVRLEVRPPPEVEGDGRCDPVGGLSMCPLGFRCPEFGGELICEDVHQCRHRNGPWIRLGEDGTWSHRVCDFSECPEGYSCNQHECTEGETWSCHHDVDHLSCGPMSGCNCSDPALGRHCIECREAIDDWVADCVAMGEEPAQCQEEAEVDCIFTCGSWPEHVSCAGRCFWGPLGAGDDEVLTTGSCHPEGLGTEVFRFSAPRTADYLFYFRTAGPSSVFVRNACRDPRTERLCDRGDYRIGHPPVIQLEENETVYVFTNRQDELSPSTLEVAYYASPVLDAAEISVHPASGAIYVGGVGRLGTMPIHVIELRFFDAAGEPVILAANRDPEQVRTRVSVEPSLERPGEHRFHWGKDSDFSDAATLNSIRTASIQILDRAAGATERLVVPVGRPAAPGEGDPCAPYRAHSQCPPGLVCQDVDHTDDAPAVCRPVVPSCPLGWTPQALHPLTADLDGDGRDDGWRAERDMLREPTRLHGFPSCADTRGDGHAFVFTAPEAGRYHFTVESQVSLAYYALWARTACGVGGSEIACSTPRQQRNGLTLELDGAETVYLFMDAGVRDHRGAYSLVARRL